MKRFMRALIGVIFMAMAAGPTLSWAKVIGKNVEYTADGVTLKGYLAYENGVKEKGPGVLVVT